ncbi:TetR/AcrR family transcriptional regulator [Solihabitans fulvus]|uniref:TetR/AcrR family transcriptional regulator n=1 Tax=Solihabitans fulvus TaxID=1892852 RepID=A0A5B2XH97_9PSEU|nr:TetR/AcrR family transcriptional regulator [Solihabitans fulvus]KAA2262576.1 TetR/AcrR family transcriptional regulator [Solihabitans fulvus]
MVRLTRAQQQERTQAAVLAAARAEFAEHGYADAKIDRIAERAELTRGAVYSNFPSKRALYLAVLLDSLPPADTAPATPVPEGPAEALGAFARTWLERLPLTGDTPAGGNLQLRSLAGVFDDEPGRTALAQVTRLEALLLALALESCGPRLPAPVRRVRLAELVVTLLSGAGHLAERAVGFGDPFDVVRACQHLADLDLADAWHPPHLPYVGPAHAVREAWQPPQALTDQLTGRHVGLDADGVIVVLGTGRLAAAEEAVRAARPGDQVTVVVVTGDPAELGRLVRLRIGDLAWCLRRVFGQDTGSPRLVLDDRGAVAAAFGVRDAEDTEAAVRLRAGEIVARANGRGAAHAAATAGDTTAGRSGGATP